MKCISKIQYPTKTQARKAAKAAHLKFGNPMYFYQCDECFRWHLSSHKTQTPRHFEIRSLNMKWVEWR